MFTKIFTINFTCIILITEHTFVFLLHTINLIALDYLYWLKAKNKTILCDVNGR